MVFFFFFFFVRTEDCCEVINQLHSDKSTLRKLQSTDLVNDIVKKKKKIWSSESSDVRAIPCEKAKPNICMIQYCTQESRPSGINANMKLSSCSFDCTLLW